MGFGIGGFVPRARLATDNRKRIGGGIVRHPKADHASFKHLSRPRGFDLREKTLCDGASRPNMRWGQVSFGTPRLERAAHAGDRSGGIFSADNGLVENALHPAL